MWTGRGGQYCIHRQDVNLAGVPYSICKNQYDCNFTNVKVPSHGYFGILIVDLDATPYSQDYMLAAIMRHGSLAEPSEAWQIEKALNALIERWNVVRAPKEFDEEQVLVCKAKSCFGDERGGVPAMQISELEVGSCGMTISGKIGFDPAEHPREVSFQFTQEKNECPGKLEYLWRFGDGSSLITRERQTSHAYDRAAHSNVRVTPRCVRQKSTCDAAAVSTGVTVDP